MSLHPNFFLRFARTPARLIIPAASIVCLQTATAYCAAANGRGASLADGDGVPSFPGCLLLAFLSFLFSAIFVSTLSEDKSLKGDGHVVLRRVLPFAILIPFVLSGLVLIGERAGYLGRETGLVMFALASAVAFGLLLWRTAHFLALIDRQRRKAERELRTSQTQMASIISSAMDAIITIDEEHRIEIFNAAAERMFGYPASEVLGQTIDKFIPERFRDGHRDHIEGFGRDQVTSRTMGFPGAIFGLRANGEEFPLDASISSMEIDGRKRFTVILRDITSRIRADAEMMERTERTIARQKILVELAELGDLALIPSLQKITHADSQVLEAERTSVWLFEGDRSALVCACLFHRSENRYEDGIALLSVNYPQYFEALEENRIIVANEARSDPRTWEFAEPYLKPMDITSKLDVPIWSQGRVIGVLCHEHVHTARQWTLEEQDFAISIANQLAHAMEASDRRAAEEKLRNSEAQLAVAQHIGHIGSWEMDVATGAITWSSELFHITGLAPRLAVFGLDEVLDLVVAEDQPMLIELYERALIDHRPCESYVRMKHTSGAVVTTHLRGVVETNDKNEPIRMYGTVQDVTEQMLAAQALERFKAILEATTDFVGILTPEKRLLYINRAGREMLGLAEDEPANLPFQDFVPKWIHDHSLKHFFEVAERDGVWEGEAALLTRSGEEIPLSQVILAHKNMTGEVEFLATIARDISERKSVEEELRQTRDELELRVHERTSELAAANSQLQGAKEEAEKANRAKSEFLSRMSHELRTPMNAILGFAQILEMHELRPDQLESVEHILKAGQHLLALINEVLDISRIESGQHSMSPEPILVSRAVQEIIALLKPLADSRNITMRTTIDEADNAYVLADQQRLKQVLFNLMSNAIKYNREGGEVVVYHCGMSVPELLEVPEGSENEAEDARPFLRICVEDTGPGLSSEDMEKLFVPFERLKAAYTRVEGTGIGLALCRRLVETMGGRVGVDSNVGVGSNFWFELPWTPGVEAQLPQKMEELSEPVKENRPRTVRKVLYIEDNQSNLILLQRVLDNKPGIQLLTTAEGHAGIDMALDELPDLILLDLHLPDMEGFEVLKRLTQTPDTSKIPIIVISADATPRQIQRIRDAGARDYLTKPINVRKFLSMFDKVLGPDGGNE